MMKKTEIPEEHQNEWESERVFEELFTPWTIVGSWNRKDYGIDGVFSINDRIDGTKMATPTGLNFFVQLKSVNSAKVKGDILKYVVEVHKIQEWHQNNLPVLLAVYDVLNKFFYYQWIDTDLITYLNKGKADWLTKKSITLDIPTSASFSGDYKKAIKAYVKTIYPAKKQKAQPGIYFELKGKTKNLITKYESLTKKFQFESPINKARQLQDDIESSIYRVAIAGPSRAGKSSLINALVAKNEVSPTGIYQTTGVPIQIIAGKEEKVEIYFQDKEKGEFKYTSSIVKKYASQAKDCNPKNREKVTLISIHLINTQLDKGVCYYDLPGLDDPNEVVAGYSRDSLKNANAVIYVIDGSNAATGGYSFRMDYKKDLESFSKENQRLFLVFNKVNFLKTPVKNSLKARVIEDLVEHSLYDKVNERVYFVSAEQGLKKRLANKVDNSISEFENELWSFILSNNKYGIYKLNDCLKKLSLALNDFQSILNTRKLNGNESLRLSNALQTLQSKIPSLRKIFNLQMQEMQRSLYIELESRLNEGLGNLRNELSNWPKHYDLPGGNYIRDKLTEYAIVAIEQSNLKLQISAQNLKLILDNWLTDNLREVKSITYSDRNYVIDFTELENIATPEIDISRSLGIGLASTLIMFLLNPSFAVATFFLAAFGSWIMSAESRRFEKINNLMKQAEYSYSKFLEKSKEQYSLALHEYSHKMADYVNPQLEGYMKDLNSQISKLGNPLSSKDEKLYLESIASLTSFRDEIEDLKEEIQVFYHNS